MLRKRQKAGGKRKTKLVRRKGPCKYSPWDLRCFKEVPVKRKPARRGRGILTHHSRKQLAGYMTRITRGLPRLERMFKHIMRSELDRGRDLKTAIRIASATVNRYRAKHGLLVSEKGRRGWYPGKRVHGKKRRHRAVVSTRELS